MRKFKLQRVVPYLLISSMLLTGCGKKSECDLPTRHVHLYTKDINNDITISRYLDSEYEEMGSYTWNEDYFEITKTDEQLYNLLNSKDLFNAYDNWDYLYYEMSHNHDYLEFYYSYYTTETYTETDDEGNEVTYTEEVHHTGWTEDPTYWHNTGDTRLNHHRYFGYRVIYKNGKFELERSRLVDDVREIMDDYPYVYEKGYTEVSEDFYFPEYQLPHLSPDDFNVFDHPDLSNTTPYLHTKTK